MPSSIILNLRKHQQLFVNSEIEMVQKEKIYKSNEIAVLVIGMWSHHQCKVADQILQELSPKVDTFLKRSRALGMKVIFGSSSLTKLPKYKQLTKNMKNIPFSALKDNGLSFPSLPFNVGADGGVVERNPDFSRTDVDIHPSIDICDADAMSDNCKEILNYLYHHGVKLCLIVGVHTNMCILDRPYGMKNMARFGFPMAIVRDLTDPMVVPDGINVINRADGLDKMIKYIETNFAPSIDSRDVMVVNPGKRIIRVDIDDTICDLGLPVRDGEDNHIYKRKTPIRHRIEHFNKLYDEGHCIIYWTSRGVESEKDWLQYTREQLERWDVKYSGIICGKGKFDAFIDDKAYNIEDYCI